MTRRWGKRMIVQRVEVLLGDRSKAGVYLKIAGKRDQKTDAIVYVPPELGTVLREGEEAKLFLIFSPPD